MSAPRPVPSAAAPPTLNRSSLGAAVLALATAACGGDRGPSWEVMATPAPGGGRVAVVRGGLCGNVPCQTIWIGPSRESATQVAPLGAARCDEIAWTPDGRKVGFLVDGYQLRLYDAESLAPAGQFSLVPPDAQLTRLARGVTFSENGRALTFDDCPRGRSGCRSGLMAVPQ